MGRCSSASSQCILSIILVAMNVPVGQVLAVQQYPAVSNSTVQKTQAAKLRDSIGGGCLPDCIQQHCKVTIIYNYSSLKLFA